MSNLPCQLFVIITTTPTNNFSGNITVLELRTATDMESDPDQVFFIGKINSCVTNYINMAQLYPKCPSEPWQSTNMHNTRSSNLPNRMQSLLLLITPVLFLLKQSGTLWGGVILNKAQLWMVINISAINTVLIAQV